MMSSILIQVDFDNTLTKGNVSELIHEQFGPFNWPEIYENYKNKLISVEESNIYSFEYLDTSMGLNSILLTIPSSSFTS